MANCDEIITGGGSITLATSAVTVYDGGSLGCVAVPADPSLNDVLEALAAKVCSLAAPFPPSSTVIMDADLSSCGISVTVAMTLNVALTNMITQICQNKTDIAAISCATIDATGCFCADWTDAYWSSVTPAITSPPITLGDVLCNMTKGIEYNYGLISSGATSSQRWRDNAVENFLYWDTATYGNLSLNIGALTCDVAESVYGYDGAEVTKPAQTITGLIANQDNYIDFDGTLYNVTNIPIGNPAPAKLSKEDVRLGFITTDGVGGILVTQLKEIQSVGTANIKNLNVTTAKVDALAITTAKLSLTGVSAGTTDIANVTVGVDGRITAIDSDFNITAPINGQIITYDLASTKWINTTQQQLPAGAATNDMLVWNNATTLWDTAPYVINNASDVNSVGITDTQILSWDTGTGTYVAVDNPEPIVKYVIDEAGLLLAFTEFNASGIGGIVKIGADITLSGNQVLDFDNGIELWGSNQYINATAANFTLSFRGAKFVVKDVVFNGRAKNLNPVAPGVATDTTNMLIFDDPATSFVSFQNCTFANLVGSSLVPAIQYVIDIQNTAIDCTFSFSGSKIASGSDTTKPYQPFRIKYSVASLKDSLRMQFRDWAVTGIGPATSSRWEDCKGGVVIRIDGTFQPDHKHAFLYDETVSWDIASSSTTPALAQWLDLFPTFWGPTTKMEAINPSSVGAFGNPGDILFDTTVDEDESRSVYIKHGAIADDRDWYNIIHKEVINSITSSYTVTASDANKMITFTTAVASIMIRLPNNATTPFPIGTEIGVNQQGTTTTTLIRRGPGMDLYYPGSGGSADYTLAGQYSCVTIKKIAIDSWIVMLP